MIRTLIGVAWINLTRDRPALVLTFVLPLVFFSIFAVIFGGMGGGGGGSSSLTVIVVDEDGSETSGKLVAALDGQDAITVETAPAASEDDPAPAAYTSESARLAVRTGKRSVAVVIPAGFGDAFGNFAGDTAAVDLVHDPSNPLVQGIVTGLVQASAMSAAPDVLLQGGVAQLEAFGGPLTPEQESGLAQLEATLAAESAGEEGGAGGGPGFSGLVAVNAVSAMEAGDDSGGRGPKIISYYAAGIGVMFLLFSMAGAGSSLLEEEERGTLERVLSSTVRMGELLAANWMFFAAVGVAQLVVMFVFGALVFGLELFATRTLVGFALMTLVTAAAAAAFGIALATICRSRAQHNGIATVVILVMSALGGSMVPRFAMPEFMNTTALFTFNGWALDGYLKVFWYADPEASLPAFVGTLVPQLGVLAAMTVVLLAVARVLARRWESA